MDATQSFGVLDGRTFTCELESDQRPGWSNGDTIEFVQGRFHSLGCDKDGYAQAPYEARVENNVISFHAETHNPQGETMRWSGTVEADDRIFGAVFHVRAGKVENRYTFRGSAQRELGAPLTGSEEVA